MGLPKLGLIAGGGQIPALIRDACRAEGRPVFIAALNGFCDPDTIADTDHAWFDLPQVGGLLKALKAAGAEEVCLCGHVAKPDFSALKPDWTGALLLPRLIKAALVGDVLFQGSIGRTDFPKGNHADLIHSIREKLFPLGDAITFVPGHGPLSTFGQERQSNPFVSDRAVGIA